MKKFRGKKRYFRNLWRDVSNFKLNLDSDCWFDFWHIHLDFMRRGNDSLKVRREHIKAHLALYSHLLNRLEKFKKPYQSWVCIHEEDTGADAVYIHTPNPNDDYFPHRVQHIKWNCEIPISFTDLIDKDKYNVGYLKSEYEELFFIQSKLNGIPLENGNL
ncbi:hypothetical protein [Aneurinibacillus uraniidurans]|uniref:hypothetical protein n=1 Tax=Aneurinibacillus uraniidurans TaxID=2966586 RepID=UPI00234BCBEF|nr:hypothetical protein [Aneurinibacillus sp. B1]WCN36686.1 hypothetical protein PO771_12495 [Aneurinibacillus sp. B1]